MTTSTTGGGSVRKVGLSGEEKKKGYVKMEGAGGMIVGETEIWNQRESERQTTKKGSVGKEKYSEEKGWEGKRRKGKR